MKELKKNNIEDISKILGAGGLVAFATETVYGLAVIFDNKNAFDKLVACKRRSPDKPFSMMLADITDINKYSSINTNAQKIIKAFMPGEITIIVESTQLPNWVTLGTNKVGIRIPNDDFVRELIRTVGKPLLVTSANRSGFPPMIKYDDVKKEFSNDLDAIVYGECVSNKPSTVIDICDKIKVLRVGSISEEQIFKELEK